MIPESRLSSAVVSAPFLAPDDLDSPPWMDRELGGVELYDASQGLQVKTWTIRLVAGEVRLTAAGSTETTLFSGAGITELSLAFDQSMRPYVAFVQAGEAKYWWYDSLIEDSVFSTLPAGTVTPRVCLDDKRDRQSGTSDVILAYVRDGNLYFRAQRDRFGVEYELQADVGGTLVRVGMNTVGRLQFLMEAA